MRAELAALELRRLSWQRVWHGMYRVHVVFNHNDLLSYASSIAFQVLYAVVPLVLLGLGLLGILGDQSVYTRHIAPTFHKEMSADAFRIVNTTARHVMAGNRRIYWTTAGLLLTLSGISGAVRAMFVPLNRIYETKETRTFWNRFVYSAVADVYLTRLVHVHGFVAVLLLIGRWLLALGLLVAAISAIVRLVPAKKRPAEWVSLGAVLSTLYYGSVSLLFGLVVDSLLYDEVRRRKRS